MPLIKAIIIIILCVWIYRYLINQPERIKKIPYIGPMLIKINPLLVIIIILIFFHLI